MAFVGLHYSNTGKRSPDHFTNQPVQVPAPPLKSAVLSSIDQEAVRKVAAHFIDTAVLRRRVDESWELTTRKLRQGMSRKEWDQGNIPVTPFPAGAVQAIKYQLDWSGENLVYLKVAIEPRDTSKILGQAFDIGLTRRGATSDHVWLVDYWVPDGVGVPTVAQSAAEARSDPVKEPGSRIPVAFVFAPIGVIALLVFGIPLAIFGRNSLRSRRALREYRRHQT